MTKEEFIEEVKDATGMLPSTSFASSSIEHGIFLTIPANHFVFVYTIEAAKPKQTAKEFIEALCKEHGLDFFAYEDDINGGRIAISQLYRRDQHGNLVICNIRDSNLLDAYKQLARNLSGELAVISKERYYIKVIQIPEFKE